MPNIMRPYSLLVPLEVHHLISWQPFSDRLPKYMNDFILAMDDQKLDIYIYILAVFLVSYPTKSVKFDNSFNVDERTTNLTSEIVNAVTEGPACLLGPAWMCCKVIHTLERLCHANVSLLSTTNHRNYTGMYTMLMSVFLTRDAHIR